MDTCSLLLTLLLEGSLPKNAVTGQLDINFNSFDKTFWSFRCGCVFHKNHDVKYQIWRKTCLDPLKQRLLKK